MKRRKDLEVGDILEFPRCNYCGNIYKVPIEEIKEGRSTIESYYKTAYATCPNPKCQKSALYSTLSCTLEAEYWGY